MEYGSEGPLAGVPRVSLTAALYRVVAAGRGGVLYPEAQCGALPPLVRGVMRPEPFFWLGELVISGVSWECSPLSELTEGLVVYV
jgi:hypothetical protein